MYTDLLLLSFTFIEVRLEISKAGHPKHIKHNNGF